MFSVLTGAVSERGQGRDTSPFSDDAFPRCLNIFVVVLGVRCDTSVRIHQLLKHIPCH